MNIVKFIIGSLIGAAIAIAIGEQADGQTKTISIGWEATALTSDGVDYFLPVQTNITITGYSITFTLYPWTGKDAAALWLISAGFNPQVTPDLPHFPSQSYPLGGGDFGQSSMQPMEGPSVHGGMYGGTGFICRSILKTEGPAVVKVCEMSGLAIPVAAGETIISHVDVAGTDTCDCEVQGVIYYQ